MPFEIYKFRCYALLWCQGNDQQKAIEWYDIIQDNNQPSISATDKNFKMCIHHLFDIAALDVITYE